MITRYHLPFVLQWVLNYVKAGASAKRVKDILVNCDIDTSR
ncbi:hypothetical protein LMG28138_05441 [Pararobbsia alpina]|uniref:Uncharacterized protein n=1 Tax=Pararobbsia alpina TaxID=621374 RepID=A0A6S7BMF9_9BURK|nr:hypothetical protein LMG28138_05441 [Pararobbsia alpina]